MSLQAEERSFEWNLEESRGVEGVARWMTWRRLEGVVFSFCDTTSSSLSPTTLGNFCPSLFPHPPPSYAISTFVVSLLSSDSAPTLLLLSSGETRSITFPGPPAWHPLYTHGYPPRGPASSTTSPFGYRTNVWSSKWRLSWDRTRGSVISLHEFCCLMEYRRCSDIQNELCINEI